MLLREERDLIKKMFPIYDGNWRDFGTPARTRVSSVEKLLAYAEKFNKKRPCFVSLAQFDPDPLLRYVFFDFDGSTALVDSLKLQNFFESNNIGPYYYFFSGNKGFHIYLEVIERHYSKQQLRQFQLYLCEKLNLSSADRHVIGDLQRLVRIPFTTNENSRKKCHLIKKNENKDLVTLDLSLLKLENSKESRFKVGDYDVKISTQYNCDDNFLMHPYPCLDFEIYQKEPNHLARVFQVVRLLSLGFKPDEIFEYCRSKRWIDFDPRITAFQINQICSNHYAMIDCSRLFQLGLCTKNCRRWRSIGYYQKN